MVADHQIAQRYAEAFEQLLMATRIHPTLKHFFLFRVALELLEGHQEYRELVLQRYLEFQRIHSDLLPVVDDLLNDNAPAIEGCDHEHVEELWRIEFYQFVDALEVSNIGRFGLKDWDNSEA